MITTILSITSIIFATQVINVSNPVHSIFRLVIVFFFTSLMRISISMEFRSLIFIMVYVGAIAVLFLFVIMRLNVKPVSKKMNNRTIPRILVIISFFMIFMWISVISYFQHIDQFYNNEVINSFDYIDNIKTIGQTLYTIYFIEFLIAGIILMVSIIGAIMLTLTNYSSKKSINRLHQHVYQQHSRDKNKAIFKIN